MGKEDVLMAAKKATKKKSASKKKPGVRPGAAK
jgi:hypothetical protein